MEFDRKFTESNSLCFGQFFAMEPPLTTRIIKYKTLLVKMAAFIDSPPFQPVIRNAIGQYMVNVSTTLSFRATPYPLPIWKIYPPITISTFAVAKFYRLARFAPRWMLTVYRDNLTPPITPCASNIDLHRLIVLCDIDNKLINV